MPFCIVNGLKVNYEIFGQGRPVVMIMGLAGDMNWWEHQIPALSEHLQVIVFDNRGTGGTDKPDERYSIRDLADDTIGLMDALDIETAHLVGISMGGMIAQEVCLNYTERVGKMVLGCTHCGGRGFIMPTPEAVGKLTLTRGKTLEEIARQIISIMFTPRYILDNPETIQTIVDRFVQKRQSRKDFRNQFWAIMGHNTYERLPEVTAPTLVITGSEDLLVPPENSSILAKNIPGARLETFSGSGHCFFIEESDRANRLLINFFCDGE